MEKPEKFNLINWLFKSSTGQIVVVQYPNLPLYIALIAWLALRVITTKPIHTILEIIFTLSLIVWAVLEIGSGSSRFRRILGAGVLVWLVVTFMLSVLK